MKSGPVEIKTDTAANSNKEPVYMACVRRQVFAKSRDSQIQGSNPEPRDPPDPQASQSNRGTQEHSEETGQDPNKIESWLLDCSTPNRGSIDDQSASLNRGALKNGCSFEDDLSLGAEANHLQSTAHKADPSFGLAADQKRSRYKERARSMNSTGSGKSSTVSSVSELLDMFEEDPEEILLNLGFGREEPDLSSKIPSRFFNGNSSARGIDIKVYLGAQLQRLELENPSYALTSRFRQMEVLTTVANEFFQLYSNVSGQQVRQINIKEQGGEGGGGGGGGGEGAEGHPPIKRNNSVRNFAKRLKTNLSRRNLLSSASELPEANSPIQEEPNGTVATPGHAHTNGHAGSEQDRSNADHLAETVNLKPNGKKDLSCLETVTEETNRGVQMNQLLNGSPEQSSSGPEHQPESADVQSEEEGTHLAKEETIITSTLENAASTLAPLKLAQLRMENTDSFDMEEIQTNEDEALPCRTSRATDLSRTVSQQSDSSGFAEEPSVYSNSSLKVQESSDSCDSETTVTSHPSQDVATPHALDQPAFDLPDGKAEGVGLGDATKADGRSHTSEEDAHKWSSEQFPQYTVHFLPKSRPEGEQVEGRARTDHDTEPHSSQNRSGQEPQPELEQTQSRSASELEPQHTEKLTETTAGTETPSEGAEAQVEATPRDVSTSSTVLSALNRAKTKHLGQLGQHNSIHCDDLSQTPREGRRRGFIPMQRSSSLPSSIVSPPRVVSSVKIQFRPGQTSCTPPRYSLKYTTEDGEDNGEEEVLNEEEEEKEQSNCLSTLIINPGVSERTAAVPPKPIPSYLQGSHCSRHNASPPPDWSPVRHPHSWSTQSVPDLTSSHHQPFQQSMGTNQNQQSWTSGQMMSPTQSPSAMFSDPNYHPSPGSNSSPLHFSMHPYTSSPYLHNQHNPPLNHYFSLTNLHQPFASPVPPHGSLTNLHQPPPATVPHPFGLGPGTPPMHHQTYSHSYPHQLPYPTPHGSQYASPYHSTPGFMNPHLHPRLAYSAPPGFGPGRSSSSTEMQLRKVLHEIRGTVQSLNQTRANTPDPYCELRAASSQQSLAEFQQRRRSLNIFRSQMTELELSIMQQQVLSYRHLSPTDRLEVEQLRALRSAVREELQELEQQLEDRLLDLTPHSHHADLHRDASVDSLSTASALRAMEPVSDLLREQFFLQSELGYDGHGPSSHPSTRSPSPVRGDDGRQTQGVYRASINITPAPPRRPNAPTWQEEQEEEGQRHGEEEEVENEEGREESSQTEGAAGIIGADNLQHLIREIRNSLAQEIRQEIYQELLAAASPQRPPCPTRQHPQ
uniref:Sperm specific antigen 2 n=1 Tax=Iconisemion striatum TaxID=60296 RepID=A0A1A7WEA4_9TELE